MPKFKVSVTRDASVTFSAEVEAADLSEVEAHMSKHGYNGPIIGEWSQDDANTYDNVEQYTVADADGNEIYQESWT